MSRYYLATYDAAHRSLETAVRLGLLPNGTPLLGDTCEELEAALRGARRDQQRYLTYRRHLVELLGADPSTPGPELFAELAQRLHRLRLLECPADQGGR